MRKTILLGVALFFLGCGKHIVTSDVIQSFKVSPTTVDANGATVTLTAVINPNASDDRKSVIFSTTGGSLLGAGSDGKLTVKADWVGTNLTATASLVGPMSAGQVVLSVAPATTSPNADYTLRDTIMANLVSPASIKLATSSFGIGANFTSEDTLIATLKSANNRKVSLGAPVQFDDVLANGMPAVGRYSMKQTASDANSQVSTFYSSAQPIGVTVYLIASAVDPTTGKKLFSDTVLINVNR
jgi:hypothetical protein